MFVKAGDGYWLSRGDTGRLIVRIMSEYQTTSDDRVLFTLSDKNDNPLIIRVLTPVDNQAVIEFTNEMTENLPIDDYYFDVRIILDAELDEHDVPIGGEMVRTPFKPIVLHLIETVGEV